MTRIFGALLIIYLLALHTSIALMEMASWSIVGITLIHAAVTRRKLSFPKWIPMISLWIVVLIGLLLNPPTPEVLAQGHRALIDQVGWMRWVVLVYGLSWALDSVWTGAYENKFLKIWVGATIVCGVYAVLQCLTGVDFVRPGSGAVTWQGGIWRPTGFYSETLTFAYCIGFLYVAAILPAENLRPKAYFWISLFAGLAAVVASQSRGAWMALGATGLVYFSLRRPRQLIWFVAGGLVIVVALISTHTIISQKLVDMLNLHVDHSEGMRLHLWRAYWQIFKDHPFFGAGINQTDVLLPEYYRRLGIQEDFVSHSHNVLLQWLAGAGVFGFGLYVWICCSFLRSAWLLRNETAWGGPFFSPKSISMSAA